MILLTGGSGTLGRELQKYIGFISPNRRSLDITKIDRDHDIVLHQKYDLIVHAAAFTDLVRAEQEKELCYLTNVLGTRNLASIGIPMLYISTEYVFDGEKGNYAETDYPNPVNFYSLTKLLGEYESRRCRSVVVRTLFKPDPFKHENACIDQFTSGDTVETIAKEIAFAIRNFYKLPPTIHIGSGKRSTYDIAIKTRPEVKPCKLEDIKTVRLPRDTSLNTTLWEKIKREN